MKCKVCGTLMGDMDLFCKVCGAKNEKVDIDNAVPDKPSGQKETSREGTGASVSKSTDHNEFTWNVYEFPKPKKTEEIDIQWPVEDYRKPKRKDIDEDEPICWDLERKPSKPAVEEAVKQESDAFFESIESEFAATKKNITDEYQSILNRGSVAEKRPERPAEREVLPQENVDEPTGEKASGLEEFGAGLPEGFFERVVMDNEDLPVQNFDDLPGGYPQRRRSFIQGDGNDTREATKKADRSIFRTENTSEEEKVRVKAEQPKPVVHSSEADKQPDSSNTHGAAGDAIAAAVQGASSAKISPQLGSLQGEAAGQGAREAVPDEKQQQGGLEENDESVKSEEDMGEMEKFFTFSKKSEEFQKLLDKEYEKIQKKNIHRPEVADSRISEVISDTLNFTLTDDENLKQLSDTQADLLLKDHEDQHFSELEIDNNRLDKKDDLQQPVRSEASEEFDSEGEEPSSYNNDRFDFIPRRDRKKKSIYPSASYAREWEAEQKAGGGGRVGYLAEMEAARASFFNEPAEDIATGLSTPPGPQQEPLAGGLQPAQSTEVLVTVAVKSSGTQGTTTRQTISMNPVTGGEPVITTETSVDPAVQPRRAEGAVKPQSYITEADDEKLQFGGKQEKTEQESSQKQPQAVSDNIRKQTDGLPFETIPEKKADDFWLNYSYENEAKEKKFTVGRVVLIVIAILLFVEIGALGITFLAPDSTAAKAVTTVQVKMVKGIQSAADAVSGLFTKDDKDSDKNKEKQDEDQDTKVTTTANPVPQADKNVLIQNALGENKNIQIIAKSDILVFDVAKDYGLKDINDSQPIANNIWYNDAEGNPVYYDQEIVRTLISYDSKWIDYVNAKDESVFGLIKPDSKAYQEAKAFQGKNIYETFKSLSIGEIRQGEKGFYVFTQEVIEKNQGGKVTTETYDWVYYLEAADNKILVVNFI